VHRAAREHWEAAAVKQTTYNAISALIALLCLVEALLHPGDPATQALYAIAAATGWNSIRLSH
jgi:hypothetical protein